jgi:hypothetical protein
MIDGQRRRTLTGHWLTTRVLEEVGRVFSALRCTHRGRGAKRSQVCPPFAFESGRFQYPRSSDADMLRAL